MHIRAVHILLMQYTLQPNFNNKQRGVDCVNPSYKYYTMKLFMITVFIAATAAMVTAVTAVCALFTAFGA